MSNYHSDKGKTRHCLKHVKGLCSVGWTNYLGLIALCANKIWRPSIATNVKNCHMADTYLAILHVLLAIIPQPDVYFPTSVECLFSWLVWAIHQATMTLFWTVSYVLNSTEGNNTTNALYRYILHPVAAHLVPKCWPHQSPSQELSFSWDQ